MLNEAMITQLMISEVLILNTSTISTEIQAYIPHTAIRTLSLILIKTWKNYQE